MSSHVLGIYQQTVMVQRLNQRPLSHEAFEGGCPAFPDRLEPIQVDIGEKDARKTCCLCFLVAQLLIGRLHYGACQTKVSIRCARRVFLT